MIANLKQNIDLAMVVETAGVELRRSGNRHVGLCPFHEEKTPSFYIFDDGRVIVLCCLPLGTLKDRDRLVDEAVLVTTVISEVNADVEPYDRFAGYSPVYYSREGGTYKFIRGVYIGLYRRVILWGSQYLR